MKKKTDDLQPMTEEILKNLKEGDPIERYGFFVNLFFVSRANDHVTMKDSHGNTKKVFEWLFLKYSFVKKDSK